MVMAEAAFKWLRLSSTAPKASVLLRLSTNEGRTDVFRVNFNTFYVPWTVCVCFWVACSLIDIVQQPRRASSHESQQHTKKHQSISNRNAVTLIPPPSAAPHRHTPPPTLPLGAIQHWAIYGRMNGCRNCHRSIHLSRAEWPYLQVQPESEEVLQVEE